MLWNNFKMILSDKWQNSVFPAHIENYLNNGLRSTFKFIDEIIIIIGGITQGHLMSVMLCILTDVCQYHHLFWDLSTQMMLLF